MKAKKPLTQNPKQIRSEHHRFLIYCEDQNAGVDYLKGLRADIRAQMKIGQQHGEPLGLVKAAIDHQARAHRCREDKFTPYDEVWCIMDVEAPEPHARLRDALLLAKEHEVHVALANPCFELWLMLHFEAVTAYHDSRQMQSALECSNHCKYSGRQKSIEYSVFRDKYPAARVNAQNLRRDPGRTYQSNPWTDIDELAERIRYGSSA